jgi:UDP-N-acetyl-D-mannosaminuronic acid dehydrogenase
MEKALDDCLPFLRNGQILILRSTVFPGITEHVRNYLANKKMAIAVAFCPERVAQGYSLREFRELPQIISAFDPGTLEEVRRLFAHFSPELLEMTPMEAEFAKLITNAWRYIQFATVNQFFMIATENGLDFNRILHACRYKYPRMAGIPGPGFAAGPCLVKDTLQLAAFCQNQFALGHSAMLINEGLPYHLVRLVEKHTPLAGKTAGILGMAFKAESDDLRDSLSYKLRKLLTLKARRVVCTDPYVQDPSLLPLETVLEEAEVLFIGTPHRVYRKLQRTPGKVWVDVWNCLPGGEIIS